MDETLRTSLTRMSYSRARQLVLLAGLGILVLTAVVMFARRVETVEVVGTLLFIPILVGFVFFDIRGGIIAGVVAAAAYAALRAPAIDAVGIDRFLGLLISRGIAYIAFGAIGGWADRQLESSLTKLEIYDQIDDYTGLFNARFFLQDTDLELSRSKRYQTVFSISLVEFPVSSVESLSRRQRGTLRRDLGRLLQEAVRTVDRPVHGFDGNQHHFAVVLPETGPEGARIFTERLGDRMADYLVSKGANLSREQVTNRSVTFPDDGEEAVHSVREIFAEIDRHEHPPEKQVAARPPEGSAG